MKNKTIVIKVGTSSITKKDGTIDLSTIEHICDATTLLKQQGYQVILVSSGAIGAGMSLLAETKQPCSLSKKQAIAAVGQAKLIQTYQTCYNRHNQLCAQILLTNDVLSSETKKHNVMQTFKTLHRMDVIPIVNENDSVSTDEIDHIVFSDNDALSAIVAILVEAELLVLFSDVEGVYKKVDNQLSTDIIHYVDDLETIRQHVSSIKSDLGRGGMHSKLAAIESVLPHQIDVLLTHISSMQELDQIVQNKHVGTFFKGRG